MSDKVCKECGDIFSSGSGCCSCFVDRLIEVKKMAGEVVIAQSLALSANRRLGREGERRRDIAIAALEKLINH